MTVSNESYGQKEDSITKFGGKLNLLIEDNVMQKSRCFFHIMLKKQKNCEQVDKLRYENGKEAYMQKFPSNHLFRNVLPRSKYYTLLAGHFILIACLLPNSVFCGSSHSGEVGTGVPCVYEGHLKTDKNWFGYLANISIVTTGRMTFEFTYPADKCCQNILFYSEDQMSIISARMNCWQKEYLLRPEEDQILRLTPRFLWSGCHMTHPNGMSTYVCEGGRSFTVDQPAHRPMSWYIAVSNCATLQGLDLQYRLVIYGNVGECRPESFVSNSGFRSSGHSESAMPNPRSVVVPKDSALTDDASRSSSCVIRGELNTTANWFGFLLNMSVTSGGGFYFQFTYPYRMQVQNIVLYNEKDIEKLKAEQTCWQKEGVIRERYKQEQVLDLSLQSSWNGCISKNASAGHNNQVLVCKGERRYNEPRNLYIAVTNCKSNVGMILNYQFEIYGFTNDLCSSGSYNLPSLSIFYIFIVSLLLKTILNCYVCA